MQKRFKILHYISLMQPIGRRSLSQALGWTERVLRAEAEFLKQQGLIDIETIGMKLTDEGYQVLEELSPYIKKIFGLNELEQKLQAKLHISRVIVVAGDVDKDEFVKKEMGRAAAQLLRQYVKENDIVTLTGGSTLFEVANMMPENPQLQSVLFVPARGGIGENHEFLANTLVSVMAKKTGGKYRLLHVPDQLSEESYNSLMNEDNIKEVLKVIRSAGIVIHGIGDAKTMALRRNTSKEILALLEEKKAIGEAFGYYFSQDGEIVYKIKTIGLILEDLEKIPHIIAVAGGKSKADAILAVLKQNYKQILVTDEGAAREILSKI
ncbi:hypothetical protein BHF71_07650 [Vulcanibacillus modesticaldus]|uniref:Uncharacterized protein n=1 Tax=Vulcanibacillus modesticaldus TaxID=337097 RepID=A0A1D2YVH3_9BACI|nr:sugar-binding domain-containing protein [Vulcanibacillus modesticaldus]OEF99720.1 hypothetical protein BHF71_07650 [Vulcanibacillus modesticaldus]